MKIVHLCLGSFYPDNYSYQENLLPKFHKELGLEVEVIASTQSFDEHGKTCYLNNVGSYLNEYQIKVTRLAYKKNTSFFRKLKIYKGTLKALEEANPDILFIHGGQFWDINKVRIFLKQHPQIKVFVDNHADFSNSATNWVSRNILHKIVWKYCLRKMVPYVEKFYGVLPVRVDFLKNVYGLPPEKCELLVMGADDDAVKEANLPSVKQEVREELGIAQDDFLIITGGKIDKWKTQTLLLMQAVQNIKNEKVKLVIFGSVTQELEAQVKGLVDGKKVQYIGWLKATDSYKYFAAADLVVFAGRHSVFWEQVAGQGIPMLVKDWQGTHHIDLGGNVRFLRRDCAEEIREEIEKILNNPTNFANMKKVAQGRGMLTFSYKEIARHSIGL